MGLSVAWACARAGHTVELVEQGPLPNPLASSVDHSRLIRYPYGTKEAYARMVALAFGANERVFDDLGTTLYVETGTLVVARGEDPWADATRASLETLGVHVEEFDDGTLARRFPLLTAEGVSRALWTPSGGVLLASRLLDALITWLRHRPEVTLRPLTRAVAVDTERALLRLENGEEIGGDRLVVAAGPWARDLMPALAERTVPSRQVALDLATTPERAAAWRAMPMVLDGIAWHGSGFYAVPPVAGLDLKVGDHSFSLEGHPDREREAAADDRERILSLARAGLRDPDDYAIRDARTCFYTVAPEERFIAEAAGASLVLAGFSGHGFKFGPLIGLAAAAWARGAIAPDHLRDWLAGHGTEAPESLRLDEA